jgi:hypothetical protein
VLPMQPASAGATAAKVFVCVFFCIIQFAKFPPGGGQKPVSCVFFSRPPKVW